MMMSAHHERDDDGNGGFARETWNWNQNGLDRSERRSSTVTPARTRYGKARSIGLPFIYMLIGFIAAAVSFRAYMHADAKRLAVESHLRQAEQIAEHERALAAQRTALLDQMALVLSTTVDDMRHIAEAGEWRTFSHLFVRTVRIAKSGVMPDHYNQQLLDDLHSLLLGIDADSIQMAGHE